MKNRFSFTIQSANKLFHQIGGEDITSFLEENQEVAQFN